MISREIMPFVRGGAAALFVLTAACNSRDTTPKPVAKQPESTTTTPTQLDPSKFTNCLYRERILDYGRNVFLAKENTKVGDASINIGFVAMRTVQITTGIISKLDGPNPTIAVRDVENLNLTSGMSFHAKISGATTTAEAQVIPLNDMQALLKESYCSADNQPLVI